MHDAVASIKSEDEDIRRLLLISESSETTVSVKGKAVVKKGEFVKSDKVLAESGETSPVSGLVTAINKGEITIRNGRPYLISPGTMLQIDSGALVLRGDLICNISI